MKRFFVVLVMIATTSAAVAQMQPPETITVSGTGRVTLRPDRFSFNVGVQTMSPVLEDAVNENNSRVAAVIAALKKAGATDADIRTSGFSLFPQQDYQQGKAPRIIGYQVSNNVTVTRSAVADVGRLLQVAVNAGVNQASTIEFHVSDPARGRDEGLRAAFDDAKAKATLLARAAGRTLGRAISINEEGTSTPPPVYPVTRRTSMAMKAEVSEVPVEGGTQEMTFGVTVTFALQ